MADEHSQPREQAHYQQPQAKKSPIPAITVVIVVILVIVAGFYVWTMGLAGPKDPYADHNIEIYGYFNDVDGISTKGVVNHGIGYRLRSLGVIEYCDRLYIGGGEGTPISPYGVYAYDPNDGTQEWGAQTYQTNSPVSTDITVNNFGSKFNVNYAEVRIFFGCENGKIYMLKDDFNTARSMFPPYSAPGDTVTYTWNEQLDGVPSGIDLWENNTLTGLAPNRMATQAEFDSNDVIFVSTANGTLYAFQGPVYDYNTITGYSNLTYPTLLWHTHPSDYPLTAPSLSADGKSIYVGSRDGRLYGIDTITGLPIPEWGGSTYTISDNDWSSSPVCTGNPPIVYAATDDGYLHSVSGQTGTARTEWSGGLQIINSDNEVDGGNLTGLEVLQDGSTIFFGSSTGYLYCYNSIGELIWDFDSTFDGALDTRCIVAPHYDPQIQKLYAPINCLNDTTSQSDDFTYLYAFTPTGNISWRLTLDGMVLASPISYNPAGLEYHLYYDVVLATVNVDADGSLSAGRLYSFSSQARWGPDV